VQNQQNQGKIKNQSVGVPTVKGPGINDRDILNDILSTQKYLTDNYNIFVREASHEKLHQTVMGVFTRTNNCNRPACLVF